MWDLVYPSLIVFGVAVVLVVVAVFVVRAVRRGPKAQAAAAAARDRAGSALLALDDAVADADVELGLAGAVYGGGAPASLARARVVATQVRDEGFADYRSIVDDGLSVPAARQLSARVTSRADQAVGMLRSANEEHHAWLAKNAASGDAVAATRARLVEVEQELGDPDARENELRRRFTDEETADVLLPTARARTQLQVARAALDRAASASGDPTASALGDLTSAERALREAERNAAAADQAYEQVLRAAAAVHGEIESARSLVRSGSTLHTTVPPEATEAISRALHEAQASIDGLEAESERRPLHTIAEISRVRDRLDLAMGDALSARARLEGAKAALPGTLATARTLIGRAENSLAEVPAAEARIRVAAARDELARARNAADVVEALDAARRAIVHAENADALVAYARAHRA